MTRVAVITHVYLDDVVADHVVDLNIILGPAGRVGRPTAASDSLIGLRILRFLTGWLTLRAQARVPRNSESPPASIRLRPRSTPLQLLARATYLKRFAELRHRAALGLAAMAPAAPALSVIIPSLNEAAHIERALRRRVNCPARARASSPRADDSRCAGELEAR